MQINRLFDIIYILLGKKKVTASELAQHFGVSRRTICRDINILSFAGIPIYTEKGKGGGIRILPEFIFNKSLISEQEQNEIISALYILSNIKTDETKEILNKLYVFFNKTTSNWLEVDFNEWSNENDFFNDLKTAILKHYIIEFDYYNLNGDRTFRSIEPIQLWFKSKSWYLKGFCLTKQEMRLYKLSRIKNLNITKKTFIVRDSLDLLSNPFLDIYNNQQIFTIKFRIESEKAYRVYDDFYESMVEKQSDGSFIVTVSWPEDNWLYGFIFSFGKYIEVLEPKHIRNNIKIEAKKILEKYL